MVPRNTVPISVQLSLRPAYAPPFSDGPHKGPVYLIAEVKQFTPVSGTHFVGLQRLHDIRCSLLFV